MLAILFAALVSVIAWQRLQPREREPVYQGKPLSSWLRAYDALEQPQQVREAHEAVNQAGTNAIPTLLRLLRARDSALKVKLMALAQRQHFIKVEYTPATVWNWVAPFAFGESGAKAQNTVPELVEIANGDISPASKTGAIMALGCIGPSAKEAVPSLLRWATNANANVRSSSIVALSNIGAEPDRVVPVLINAVHDPNFRTSAVLALENFGPDAKSAVPALLELLAAHNSLLEDSVVAEALVKIDPEAAAKAGVK